jgi:hypothetical protein
MFATDSINTVYHTSKIFCMKSDVFSVECSEEAYITQSVLF